MFAVVEISESVLEYVASAVRCNYPMVRFAPTCPSGVTNASIYIAVNHRVTWMVLKGKGYAVISSSSINPNPVMFNIKKEAERRGGYCQVLHGVEANEIIAVAQQVT